MDPVSFFDRPTVSLAETSLMTPTPSESHSSPVSTPGMQDEKKQVKKRKSWGQELPTPKTNLPPRKRAKTEDEKEQRRIERVLRNRQAAQSSRERKRQEVEKLEGERDVIHYENRALKARLMAVEEEKFNMKQQLAQMRDLLRKNGLQMSSPPASPILGAEMFKESIIKQEVDSLPSLFETPQPESVDPRASIASTASPAPRSSTPAQTEETLGDAPASDLAQHPAEMLCGLPCQSKAWCPPVPSSRGLAAVQSSQPLHPLHLFLMAHSITCSSLAIPLSQLLVSLKKGTRLKAETMTPTMFSLTLWLISTPRSPLKQQPTTSPSTATPSSTHSPSTSTPPTTRSSTFRTSLLRRLLTCSPALARPLKDATARALHEKAKYALRGMSQLCAMGGEEVKGEEAVPGSSSSKAEVWRLMTVALVIDQFEKQRTRLR